MDNETMRKAAELADGFEYRRSHEGDYINLPFIGFVVASSNVAKDALVAQLKRQVDATKWKLHEYRDQTIICRRMTEADDYYTIHKGDDRVENSLRAILDSRVLEKDNG